MAQAGHRTAPEAGAEAHRVLAVVEFQGMALTAKIRPGLVRFIASPYRTAKRRHTGVTTIKLGAALALA